MKIVNLFGGPGSGKSTTAAGVFAILKHAGVSTELVTEFAKECAWEGREGPLRCQPYVFGQQMWRIERLRGRGVDVVVTDSPILLSTIYAPPGTPAAFKAAVREYAEREDALNVFVRRMKPFQPIGRVHTADEASELDGRILELVRPIIHLSVLGTDTAAAVIAARILKEIVP